MTIQKYDKIGDYYNDVPNIPTGKLQIAALKSLIGDIEGLTVLELACGSGFYCRKAIEWGASRAVGVDISQAMVDAARICAEGDSRIEYHVADCGQPFDFGQFDVVLAPWLLNYARNQKQLLDKWRNIYNSLKPGGKIIGISPNVHILEDLAAFPQGPQFGQELKVLGEVEEGGLEVQATLFTSTPFSFSNYYLPRELYDRSSKLAGIRDFQWTNYTKPLLHDMDWDAFIRCPPFRTFTATRPTEQLERAINSAAG
ncbi:S-adenosyl-L-methionine-dependent methyltransferase [Aspergillus leporis]|jgi:SAM-dependent methyltransferase|uniref:S-adenosyl-L-methionine-dependent methyltransferase n=1 Tax=Aspergillus leporis TaxID=41062 RepID=A0A5N5WIL1_9EURO|nr:S-adenosyl-L-methionine-dependent methyltransferase [Aspergillus leporis]